MYFIAVVSSEKEWSFSLRLMGCMFCIQASYTTGYPTFSFLGDGITKSQTESDGDAECSSNCSENQGKFLCI